MRTEARGPVVAAACAALLWGTASLGAPAHEPEPAQEAAASPARWLPAVAAAPSPARGERALTVDAGASTVRFHVVHRFHDVVGSSRRIEAKAVVRDDGTVLAMARVPLATLDSGEANRDANMREVLEVGKYPFVVFKGVARLDAGRSLEGRAIMSGELDLHGVSRAIAIPLSVEPVGHDAVRVRGQFDVSLEAHRIERPSLLFVRIDDRCRIEVDLLLREASG